MKPTALQEGLTLQVAFTRVLFILLILIFLLNSLSLAADDEASRAVVRHPSPESASKRVALIIGNKDYNDAPLRNPVNDAEDLGPVLRRLGFSVITKTNVNPEEFEDAISQFSREIADANVAVFYFSGHGCQAKGENYLLPVGYSFNSEADLRRKALSAGFVLDKMEEAKTRINIMILDACRNNPFKWIRSQSRGLAQMVPPDGSFIAYATAPGKVAKDGEGRNSPYTKHLLSAIELKGLDIEQVFRIVSKEVRKETSGEQVPWRESSLTEEFLFNPSEEARREGEQELDRLREAAKLSVLEKERLEREKREHEQEVARLRDAERLAALEKERLEREKREIQRELDRQRQREGERESSLPTPAPARPPSAKPEPQNTLDYAATVTRLVRLIEQSNDGARKEMDSLYNNSQAMTWIVTAANQGDPDAQFALARRYHLGKGVSKDYSEANRLYLKAAEQGCAGAECNLGYLYYYGQGVAKDRAKAFEWFRRAADHGDADAKRMLASKYNK